LRQEEDNLELEMFGLLTFIMSVLFRVGYSVFKVARLTA